MLLSDVVIRNWKIEREFSLLLTKLYHSPIRFVQLSIAYSGAWPDVIAISKAVTEFSSCEFIF